MGSLGDAFPEKIKIEYAESQIICGSVIFLSDEEAGKPKYHVIVGFDGDRVLAATVRINSEVNLNVYDTEEKRSMCHPISPNNVNFLHHDSFIPCDKIIQWDRQAIVQLALSKPDVVIGTLPQGELETVQYKISTAITISTKTKKKFGLFIQ